MISKTNVIVCKDLQDEAVDNRNFLSEVVTRDESLFCVYAPHAKWWYLYVCTSNKQQSSQWKIPSSTCPKLARQGTAIFESMFIVFFDSEQMLHAEFILPCQTVNRHFYVGFLRHWRRMSGEESQTSGTLRTGFCVMILC